MPAHPARAALATLVFAIAFPAQSAPAIAVPTFTLEYADSSASPSASVISTDHTQTILSMHTMGAVLHALRGGAFPANETVQERFSLTATSGYRITGMRLSASVTGAFEVGQPPAGATDVRYGDAGNRMGVWFGTSDFKPVKAYDKSYLTQDELDVMLPVASPGTAVAVYIEAFVSAWGYATYFDPGDPWSPDKVYGLGQIDVWNPRLTIYTEAVAVPEPSTWAMLGVGLVALAAGRRYRVAARA